MTAEPESSTRDEMPHTVVGLLNHHEPDALQIRKIAGAASTWAIAVYNHFGGIRTPIAEGACSSSAPC
ncbi:hypothetical protein [Mycobacterium leprae]|uniref:hypothetical protein n=1 Tax=Mycobacterium leprae TaxID=1769 RepID=UPI0003143491